jgi:hypothetical protein
LFCHPLVFGSSVLEMSSRRQAVAARLYATWGKQRPPGALVRASLSSLRGCKVLPLTLELCLSGLQVHLPRAQVVHLLKVGRTAAGTLVRWCGPWLLLRLNLAIDVVAHARGVIIVDVVGVILWAFPR